MARTVKNKTGQANLTKARLGKPVKTQDAPLYLQLASTLRTAIVRGIYPVGSRMPTEEELCERFQVSRHTVREALRKLRADGLITSRENSRPVVVPPSAQNAVRLWTAGLDKEIFEHSMGTRLDVQSMEMVRITKAQAAQFDLGKGEEWLRVTGNRTSGDSGAVLCWYEYLINAEYAAIGRLLPRHVGPIVLLVEDFFSEKMARMQYSMSAVPMPAAQAGEMNVAAGSPALRIQTRCETEQKTAMVVVSLHPVGNVAYTITLQEKSRG